MNYSTAYKNSILSVSLAQIYLISWDSIVMFPGLQNKIFSKCKSLESLISLKIQDFTNYEAIINVYKYLLFIFERGYPIKDLNT